MTDFFLALGDPDLPFLRYALISGLLASVPFGIIGSFVVVRRISYIAGAISHCVLAGVGLGLYLQQVGGVKWFTPYVGAVLAALIAAVILAVISLHAKQREDSVIGALWAAGMAIGLLFIAKTPGYNDPMSYLFGNILLIGKQDIYFVLSLDVVVVAVVAIFYNKFLALCFDEEYAMLRGLHTGMLYLSLLCLTALTVVLLVRVVGIVMVIALLTLPAAIAGNFAKSLWQMMVYATLLCSLFVFTGLWLSYGYDLPSGPVIIIIATLSYLLAVGVLRKMHSR